MMLPARRPQFAEALDKLRAEYEHLEYDANVLKLQRDEFQRKLEDKVQEIICMQQVFFFLCFHIAADTGTQSVAILYLAARGPIGSLRLWISSAALNPDWHQRSHHSSWTAALACAYPAHALTPVRKHGFVPA